MKFVHTLFVILILAILSFSTSKKKSNLNKQPVSQSHRNYRKAYPLIASNPLPTFYTTGPREISNGSRKYRTYTKYVSSRHSYPRPTVISGQKAYSNTN